ncbi:zinc finger protein SNAI2-like [Myzus persicae]|uniref:zinc finger protein SNAI2-like n=1 Tax=Myzus persicae TaxID=13164 RepID=UPI000B930405|nr:zinc finger protein SNAI2-like [Myzus persicae]
MVLSSISPRFSDLPLEILRCNTDMEICELCQKNFASLDGLKRHQKSVHPKRVKEGKQFLRVQQYFECNYCNKKFLRKDTLIRHIKCGHLFESDVFECFHCSRKYARKNDLANHISECFNYKIADCPKDAIQIWKS